MKPIAIFRHLPTEGPGYFATFLERHSIPWELVAIDRYDAVPTKLNGYSGLVFMGGPMSVNDSLPWIAKELALISDAVTTDIPVLGHCLGGQLMAKALGGVVTKNAVKEIGWGAVQVPENEAARAWFGELRSFTSFHWHGETFSLPAGAKRVLESAHCANQGFVMGKHLALQCHVEMTETMIDDWCKAGTEEITASPGPAVQSVAQIKRDTTQKLAELHVVADGLYTRWIAGLAQ